MTTKNKSVEGQKEKQYFVGSYVEDMNLVISMALAANLNAIFIGKPGTGKSAVSTSMLDEVYGRENYGYIEIEPTIPTDEVKGPNDFGIMVEESRLERNSTGTITDLDNQAIVIDEIGRARDEMWDMLLYVLHPRDERDHRPTIATANTMPEAERQQAMLDRIAIWFWVIADGVSAVDIARAKLMSNGTRLSVPGRIPAAEEIDFARTAVPGEKAIKAVLKVLSELETEALKEMGVTFNQRTITQFTQLLYHGSAYITGDADFGKIPADVMKVLGYCWPALDPADQVKWKQVVESCGGLDFVVQKVLAEVAAKAKEVSEISSDIERSNQNGVLIKLIGEKQRELKVLVANGDDDDRAMVKNAKGTMQIWASQAARGVEVGV